jgi:tetratricopeptide (TPR) repeat protein
LAVVLAALLGGCATVDEPAPSPRRKARAATAADRPPAVPEVDRVLVDYRSGVSALRRGDDAEAKAKFDDAIARIGGIIANDEQAARARGLFSAEREKPFIGEPYERVMAYYYRGILYWRDGQPDNARACFRSGQVIDSDVGKDAYAADYVLLDYLDGLVSARLAADGSDALARARAHAAGRVTLPDYNPAANVLIFAEYGLGPRKFAAGQYGEQLRFRTEESVTRAARLILEEGRRVVPLPAFDDLNFQATTRGGRVMDHILGNKAVFKAATNVASDVALMGSAVAAQEARRRAMTGRDDSSASNTAIGLGLLGVVGKVVSAATQTQADTRQWDNLPQRLSFAAVKLPPGDYRGRIEFIDRNGAVLAARTRSVAFTVPAEAGRDTVVFLSELPR